MPDDELERFKTTINLSEFAASRGYVLDRRESSRNSAVMRHPDGDKIVIARNEAPATWIYFSVRDDRDNGTIIDFLQNRGGGSLGEVRKTLRAWLGGSRPRPAFNLPRSSVNCCRYPGIAPASCRNGKGRGTCTALPYLTSRGLGPDVLALPRFAGRVRVDQRNNALFPHYDKDGLCGFEIKNKGFTGFAPGGVKGLWHSAARSTDYWLVLTESAIDAYSFQVIHGGDSARYMSTGGALNPQQPAFCGALWKRCRKARLSFWALILMKAGKSSRKRSRPSLLQGGTVRRMMPDVGTGKDWNEMLKNRLGLT